MSFSFRYNFDESFNEKSKIEVITTMKIKLFKMVIFVLLFFTCNSELFTDSCRFKANASYPLGNYMVISIMPAGTFELKDPDGRRFQHQPGKEDINEIPGASCSDLAYAEDDTMMNEIYIAPLIEGRYQLKILQIPGKDYFLNVRLGDEDKNKIEDMTFENVPIAKGHVHVYDLHLDLKSNKMKMVKETIKCAKS